MRTYSSSIRVKIVEFGGCYLVGGWPTRTLIDPDVLPLLGEHLSREGNEYTFRLENGWATYRHVSTDFSGCLVLELEASDLKVD